MRPPDWKLGVLKLKQIHNIFLHSPIKSGRVCACFQFSAILAPPMPPLRLNGIFVFSRIMKLYITDHADPTVGLFESRYDLDCPLNQNDEPEELEQFRKMAIELYSEFSFGRVSAIYDFEQEKRELEYEQMAQTHFDIQRNIFAACYTQNIK